MTILLIISLITIVAIVGSASIGAIINDLRTTQHLRRAAANENQLSSTLVTVLITAPVDTIAIKNTLEHILESSYHPIEIILIVDKHQRAVLKKLTLQLEGPKRSITFYTGNGGLRTAYRRHGRGGIILTLRADHQLDRRAIEHAVQHFTTLTNLTQLQPHIVASLHYSTTGLLQGYLNALVLSWRKLMNLTASTHPIPEPDASFYRVDAFMKEPQRYASRTFFADDTVIQTPAANFNYLLAKKAFSDLSYTYRSLWYTRSGHPLATAYWRLLACCLGGALVTLPLTLTYAVLLAATALQPMLLFVMTAVASTCILLGLWSHQAMTNLQKFSLSYLLPVCLMPLYVATFIYAVMTIIVIAQSIYSTALHFLRPVRKLQPD